MDFLTYDEKSVCEKSIIVPTHRCWPTHAHLFHVAIYFLCTFKGQSEGTFSNSISNHSSQLTYCMASGSNITANARHKNIQAYVEGFEYNYTGENFYNVKVDSRLFSPCSSECVGTHLSVSHPNKDITSHAAFRDLCTFLIKILKPC